MIRRRVLYRKKSEITPAYSADNLVFTGSNYVDTGKEQYTKLGFIYQL
jgi:hypothetical protein